jgi:hypothetical protein
MSGILDISGPERAVSLFGVKLVGFTAENGTKFLLTVGMIVTFWLLSRLLRLPARVLIHGLKDAMSLTTHSQAEGLP